MATSKDIFAGWAFAPRVFAPGAFRGLGVEVDLVAVPGVELRIKDTRPHYMVQDTRPHYISRGTD